MFLLHTGWFSKMNSTIIASDIREAECLDLDKFTATWRSRSVLHWRPAPSAFQVILPRKLTA
ncbi:hypothetical protein LINPERPRIM_LOCUS19200, partial [Linum perenne]